MGSSTSYSDEKAQETCETSPTGEQRSTWWDQSPEICSFADIKSSKF